MGLIIRILSRFLLPVLKWFGRVGVWCLPFFAWLKKAFTFVLNKLLIAYISSRFWLTGTMVMAAFGIVASFSELFSILASLIGSLIFDKASSLDQSSLQFLANYITFDWLFEMLGFGFGSWLSYLALVKSLVIMKYTHKIFDMVSKAVK